MRSSHEPVGAPNRHAWRTIELPPMISSRLIVRSPIFVMLPNRCLPPVECWRGESPSQAATSRPLRNVSIGEAKARACFPNAGRREAIKPGDLYGGAHQFRIVARH